MSVSELDKKEIFYQKKKIIIIMIYECEYYEHWTLTKHHFLSELDGDRSQSQLSFF